MMGEQDLTCRRYDSVALADFAGPRNIGGDPGDTDVGDSRRSEYSSYDHLQGSYPFEEAAKPKHRSRDRLIIFARVVPTSRRMRRDNPDQPTISSVAYSARP